MVERIRLHEIIIEIDERERSVTSVWPDGVRLVAKPNYDDESVERAKDLGYGHGDVWAMTREHDAFHHILCQAEGARWSEHLRAIAAGREPDGDGHREECLVLLLQRVKNRGLPNG